MKPPQKLPKVNLDIPQIAVEYLFGGIAHLIMNGKPGDHPINDICDHKLPVFSPRADDLVREIHQFLPRHRMWDLFDWFSPPPLAEFERQLEAKRDELREDARKRGWEAS